MVFSSDREVTGELGLNNCGIQTIGGASNDRTRRDFSLLYVAKGRAFLLKDGAEQTVSAGQAMLFPPGCRQVYRFDPATENVNMWAHFGGTFCRELDGTAAQIITVSDRNEFESDLQRLIRAHGSMAPLRQPLLLAYLRVLVCLLLRDSRLQQTAVKAQNHLNNVLDLIHTNVGSDVDWDACAAMCYMSRDRFNHVFREYVGLPPEQYRIKVCMERAKVLLCDFGFSVSECAETLGFHDVSYFCRRFRKEFGVSPAKFKQ